MYTYTYVCVCMYVHTNMKGIYTCTYIYACEHGGIICTFVCMYLYYYVLEVTYYYVLAGQPAFGESCASSLVAKG